MYCSIHFGRAVRSAITFFTILVGSLLTTISIASADVLQGMDFLAKVNDHAKEGYSAIWGYTHPDGREYALLGVRNGTSFIDITDSNNIKEVAFLPSKTTNWRELKTYKNYAYVVTDRARTGIEIYDLSGLPGKVTLAAKITDLMMSHTLWVDEAKGLLYTMGGSGDGVVVLSLADPLHPKEVSRFGTAYVHDAFFRGNMAILSEIESQSFSFWDISDLKQPKLLKRYRDEKAPWVSFHNSWVTEDGKYLVTTEESEGRTVKIWDIQNLDKMNAPVAEWLPPNKLAHNVQIKGQYAYFSSYGGGIRVLDLKDPIHPVEVAYWARNDGKEEGFVSVWGVYPYFKSGKIIASDIEDGLIVTQFEGAREK